MDTDQLLAQLQEVLDSSGWGDHFRVVQGNNCVEICEIVSEIKTEEEFNLVRSGINTLRPDINEVVAALARPNRRT